MPGRRNARLAGRIGALALHSQRDARETTTKARAAFLVGFEKQVDPRGILEPEERRRRAGYALRLHMARLALARRNAANAAKTSASRAAGPPVGLSMGFAHPGRQSNGSQPVPSPAGSTNKEAARLTSNGSPKEVPDVTGRPSSRS